MDFRNSIQPKDRFERFSLAIVVVFGENRLNDLNEFYAGSFRIEALLTAPEATRMSAPVLLRPESSSDDCATLDPRCGADPRVKSPVASRAEKLLRREIAFIHNRSFSRAELDAAQALLGDPKLIIVDEPTAGLDPEERNRFLNLLADVSQNVVVIL